MRLSGYFCRYMASYPFAKKQGILRKKREALASLRVLLYYFMDI